MLHKIVSDKRLRAFAPVLGLYCFNPCSSVEWLVNEKCRPIELPESFFRQGLTGTYSAS